MLFNSLAFLVFFAIVYPTYRVLSLRGQNRLLLLTGYLFYGWWDVRFLFLLALSTGIDFSCGLMLGTGRVPARDRRLVSIFVLASAFGFATIQWDAVRLIRHASTSLAGSMLPTVAVEWGRLLPTDLSGWGVLLGSALGVLISNIIYVLLAAMPESRRRPILIVLTVAANLALLGFFKYFNFFIDSASGLIRAMGFSESSLYLHIVLPVGLSFYTFQSMSYTIDVYRKKFAPVHDFWDYAVFVAFFPPLVAGPIERASHLVPQLVRPRTPNLDQSTRGLYLMLLGYFKKVAIADGLAGSVSSVYGSPGMPSWSDIVLATLYFAIQIYCDFSGYTDIARGVGKLLGIELFLNFDLPYVSRGPTEFWQRWHISLSSWLRDYLYIPLGGNRLGRWKTYRNLMLTMLLGGLWHGAAWNFVLWGLYHGLVLCAYRAVGAERVPAEGSRRSPRIVQLGAWALFFMLTCYGWLLFRAGSLGQVAMFTMKLLTGFNDLGIHAVVPRMSAMYGLPLLIGYELVEYACGSSEFYRRLPAPVRAAWYAALCFVILMGLSNEPAKFIYFQF